MSSRALAAVILANLACLGILNAFRLPVWALVWLYPPAAGAMFVLLRPSGVRAPRVTLPRSAYLLVLAAFVLLTAPRLPYLLELIPGNVVLAEADDYGRLAELISLTLSPRFPPLHPSNQDYLLSHYFAALLPMAWLKLALPFLTLKECILLGNLAYHALMLASILEVARHALPDGRRATAFVFLMTLFGGMDWIFEWRLPFSHAEHWPRQTLGIMREFSSFYTAHFWVVHHMAGFWALVLANLFATRARWGSARRKGLILCGLAAAAAVHSPFVFLGAVFCGWRELYAWFRRGLRTGMVAAPAAFVIPALPFFLGRLQTDSVWWNPVPGGVGGLLLYLLGLLVIETVGLPVLAVAAWNRMRMAERRHLTGAGAFALLTWGVESVGCNNLAMRGLLVPALVLFWLVAKHGWLPRRRAAAAAVAAFLAFGTLREAAWLTYQPLEDSLWYWQVRGLLPPPRPRPFLLPAYTRAARQTNSSYYTPGPVDRIGLNKFNAEKLVIGIPWEAMESAERELARRSLSGW